MDDASDRSSKTKPSQKSEILQYSIEGRTSLTPYIR